MSLSVRPALASAFWVAPTGPIPIIRGSTPTTAELTIRALGVTSYLLSALPESM